MTKKAANIDWSRLPSWVVSEVGNAFIVKVADTSIKTGVTESVQDRNMMFAVHATDIRRVIGYSLCLKSRRQPSVTYGRQYLGVFFSGLRDLQNRDERSVDVLYHDQNVRFLAFGTKPSSRDYLVVLRNRNSS